MSDLRVRHGVEKLSRRATTLIQTSWRLDSVIGSYELSKSRNSKRNNFGTISRLQLGSPEKKSHSDVASAASCKEYYMGQGGGFPRIQAVVSQVSPRLPVACPNTKRVQNSSNQLVVGFNVDLSK
jgi:hypothetical protein